MLSLLGGIHFRNLTLTWVCEEDLLIILGLVERCSHTLESLRIGGRILGTLNHSAPHVCTADPPLFPAEWGSADRALEGDKSQRRVFSGQISFEILGDLPSALPRANTGQTVRKTVHGQWSDLDRLLVQLWELRSIRPKFIHKKGWDSRDRIGCLMPEVMGRGTIDLVDCYEPPRAYC